jgi:hypothetical protein
MAGEKPLPTKKIMNVVRAYAGSIGCFVHMNPDNIIRFKLDGTAVIVVLYSIDALCSGGNAMHRPAFAVIAATVTGGFRIIPEYSLPRATSDEFPQYIETVYVKDNEIWYSAKEFNWGDTRPGEEGDALCCPSRQVEGRVAFQNGKWLKASER